MNLPLSAGQGVRRRNLWPLWAVLAVTIAPVIASYVMYYGVKPEGRTNYGDFVEPQVVLETVAVTPVVSPQAESAFLALQAEAQTRRALQQLGDWRGRWLMVRVGPAACNEACQQELWLMRQVRLTTGRERDRVERLWVLTDNGQPDPALIAQHEGLWVVRLGDRKHHDQLVSNWLSVATRGQAATGATAAQGSGASNIWIVDPLGNLMMRFPDNPDPNGMKKDLNRLLKASRIG
jgi:hypothetical protein